MSADSLTGSIWNFFLYDVAEEIRLDDLRRRFSVEPSGREPSFRGPAPDYVRFEKPPVVQNVAPLILESVSFRTSIHYYHYGVICLAMELPFESGWEGLVDIVSRWVASPGLEQLAQQVLEQQLESMLPMLVDQYSRRLSEDYCFIHLRHLQESNETRVSASRLLQDHGSAIAQIVRGERRPLADDEVREILQSKMSYYPDDLLVVGWNAAFLYDSPEGAIPIRQLLEYANSQLLNFRHYDEHLTSVLAGVYASLDQRRKWLARWRMARRAEELDAVRLDVEELTERMDNSIKFLSDMYWARVYRLAASKIGVPDYRKLVDEKLATAAELYRSMMDQFHENRAFILELMVVVILIIDLVFLFRGT